MKSYGKQFERQIYNDFDKSGICIDRVKDDTRQYIGVKNICDFYVFSYPNAFYLECKEIKGNTLNFTSHIREAQWEGLMKKTKYKGVFAGVIVWFFDHNRTIYVNISELHKLKENGGKSLNIKHLDQINYVEVTGKKKKVMFSYNAIKMIEDIKDAGKSTL